MLKKMTALMALGLFVTTMAAAGCNTVEGAGEDLEGTANRGEEVMQDMGN